MLDFETMSVSVEVSKAASMGKVTQKHSSMQDVSSLLRHCRDVLLQMKHFLEWLYKFGSLCPPVMEGSCEQK